LNIYTFIDAYIKRLNELLTLCDTVAIGKIVELFDDLSGTSRRVYFIGNGGSAATASHMVNDFGTGLRRRGLKNLDVISLSDNSAVITALSNDIGYDMTFLMQIKDIIMPSDVLFAISCSGNSPNVIKAVKYAKSLGTTIVGITGFQGGKLKGLADINFHVPTAEGEYGLCEDMHMILDHIIYSYYTREDLD
jgi:D-sedoheptulose 7-phosphate isomerase